MSEAPRVTDVCLILEGTYPYVRGGVSSWVHGLVTGLPDLTFSLLHISPTRHHESDIRYEMPPNVEVFAEVFVHESIIDDLRPSAADKEAAWNQIRMFHRAEGAGRHQCAEALLQAMSHGNGRHISVKEALTSHTAWEFVLDRYAKRADGTSFIDYFWTWRAVHAPLLQTLVAEIPPARMYHTICTGYAGLLGVVAKMRTGRPLVLTEHGIYVRERIIDIARADWIYEEPVRVKVGRPGTNPLKEMWINFFTTLGEITYNACDEVITLFGGNMDIQHQLGADPKITRVIPNGVMTEVFGPLREQRAPEGSRPLRVGFVGRVVPIKDVKTLVKACAGVARKMPDVEYWIVGPTDEDIPYFEECQELTGILNLGDKLKFTGSQDVKNVYPEIDVMVLTSVSEGQPLTILEAACAGVPSVATDVGSCRELLEGRTEEDRALGVGGLITGVGAPEQTAAAILEILGDDELRARMARAAIERTERFYRQEQVIERYHDVYMKYSRA